MTKEAERFTLRIPKELKNQLVAKRKPGVSLNAQVIQILWTWADQQQRPPEDTSEQANLGEARPSA